MALDLLAWLGSTAAWLLAKPILEDFAKDLSNDIAKDASKSLLGKIYHKTFSKLTREPLAKATLLALKEFIELVEEDLLNADIAEELLTVRYQPFIEFFVKQDTFLALLEPLFTEPNFMLDAAILARAWDEMTHAPTLPDEFSWERIAKAFKRRVAKIRDNYPDIKQAFVQTQTEQTHAALLELQGLPPDFDQENYREALLEKFQNVGFDCLDSTGVYYNEIRLWQVFVAQSCRECFDFKPQLLEIPKEHQKRLLASGELATNQLAELERQRYFQQPLRSVLEVCADKYLPYLVILGDPGSGKSSLLRYLALQWANLPTANERLQQPLPLLIELREYNRWECASGKSFLRYLHEARHWHRLNQQTLNSLMQQAERVVLLLDGLDEIFDPVQREQVINDIHRFSNDYKQVRIIVSSRVVGYQPKALRDAGFRDFMLQDLAKDQIQSFLQKWHDTTFEASKAQEAAAKRERLTKAIENSRPIALLAGNPLLLTMMAILNRHQELPRNRSALYQKAAEVLLHQWDTERALASYPELRNEFDLQAKTALLRRIAEHMQTAPEGLAGNIIDGEVLKHIIENFLRDELHFEQARGAANAVVKQLRERNFILCFVGANSYAFVHRTFLEYFCAADIAYKFNHQRALNIEDLIALFDSHYMDDAWREVLRLICGQIDESQIEIVLNKLIEKTDLDTWNFEQKPIELAFCLYCISEVRNPYKLIKLLIRIHDNIIKILQIYFDHESDSFGAMLFELYPKIIDAMKGIDIPFSLYNSNLEALSNISIKNEMSKIYWPNYLAHFSKNKEAVLKFLDSEDPNLRSGALDGLCEVWPQDISLEFLQNLLNHESDTTVQNEIMTHMDKLFQGELLVKLIKEFLLKIIHKNPLPSIPTNYLEILLNDNPDEETRSILELHVSKATDYLPRTLVLSFLWKTWKDYRTLKFTQTIYQSENDPFTREVLMSLISIMTEYLEPNEK